MVILLVPDSVVLSETLSFVILFVEGDVFFEVVWMHISEKNVLFALGIYDRSTVSITSISTPSLRTSSFPSVH